MNMTVGENIKRLRELKGLSQLELAKTVGKTQQAVDAWERNIARPISKTLEKVASALGVTPNDLYGLASEPTKQKKPKDLLKILEQEDFTLNGRIATPEDRERLVKIYEAMYWDAKEKNKRK